MMLALSLSLSLSLSHSLSFSLFSLSLSLPPSLPPLSDTHTSTSTQEHLQQQTECPTCGQDLGKMKTQRVVNNMAEKLAKRVMSPEQLLARHHRQELSKQQQAQCTESMPAITADTKDINSQAQWRSLTGASQLGSDCTVFRHMGVGSVVEVFHANGWFRFRAKLGAASRSATSVSERFRHVCY